MTDIKSNSIINSHIFNYIPSKILSNFPYLQQISENYGIKLNLEPWFFNDLTLNLYLHSYFFEHKSSFNMLENNDSDFSFTPLCMISHLYEANFSVSFLTKQLYFSKQYNDCYITVLMCNNYAKVNLPVCIWDYIFSFCKKKLTGKIYHLVEYSEPISKINFSLSKCTLKTSVYNIIDQQSSISYEIKQCSHMKHIDECTNFNIDHNPITCEKCKSQASFVSTHLLTCKICKRFSIKPNCWDNHTNHKSKSGCYKYNLKCNKHDNFYKVIDCTKCRKYNMHLRNCIDCMREEIKNLHWTTTFTRWWYGSSYDDYDYNDYDYNDYNDYDYNDDFYPPEFKLENESKYNYKKHGQINHYLVKKYKNIKKKILYKKWQEEKVKPVELYKIKSRKKNSTKQLLQWYE